MTEFRRVTPDFAVAAQLQPGDFERAAAAGFTLVVCNRPDGEATGQPTEAQMRAAAEAAGLTFMGLPFTGRTPPPGVVAGAAALLEAAKGPVLAYCRTGTRSITAWAMAQALSGARRPEEIIELAQRAGYDLEGAREALETLAPRA
ncbi:MAG: TIGR01244 family sulfur transferase [Hyphomonadaceae bacterium]